MRLNHFLTKSQSIFTCNNSRNCNPPIIPFIQLFRQRHTMQKFSEWKFTVPGLLSQFPVDPIEENFVRRVPNAVFSRAAPTPLTKDLQLVSFSSDACSHILDLDPCVSEDPLFVNFVGGGQLAEGSVPLAHRYGGHQFGYWADQLGDGRAILLGEFVNNKGERWELQLKGAGETPYSRTADGRAVLRSSIREYLCSEAMEALGIPTSRAAALVVSKDMVVRDQFYNGRMKKEPAAIVLRLAPSWFRIGSLEILSKNREVPILKQVVDFMIDNFYPELGPSNYTGFFKTVVDLSASLVAKWMAVGFTHGVLNTDNMSLLSITIDYGPFGYLDAYDSSYIPNHSDDYGRYSYANQPKIFKWNMARLAAALEPLLAAEETATMTETIRNYDHLYRGYFLDHFRKKLGLTAPSENEEKLIQLLLHVMEEKRADFTQTFRQLSLVSLEQGDFSQYWALDPMSKDQRFLEFLELYRKILGDLDVSEEERQSTMKAVNPQYVLRNWMAEAAIRQAELEDFQLTNLLLKVLKNPYQVNDEAEQLGFSILPPTWSCSLRVSCSS